MSQIPLMIAALDRIAVRLAQSNRAVAPKLQPGLSPGDIAARAATLPFALTIELEALYQWRNGTLVEEGDLLGQAYLFPGFYLLSLDEAVQTYAERKGSRQWRRHWFPVFADGGGDFFVVPCAPERREAAEVIGFIHGEPEQTVEYESLAAMMQTLDACYAQGAFFLDDDGELEVDDDKHREIAHHFNPQVEEWQS